MAGRSELMAFGLPWQAAGALGQSASTALVAAGTNQATGLALTSSVNEFATVANGAAATLPSANGQPIHAGWNGGANTLQLFAAVGETMNATLNGSFNVPSGCGYVLVPHMNRWIGILTN